MQWGDSNPRSSILLCKSQTLSQHISTNSVWGRIAGKQISSGTPGNDWVPNAAHYFPFLWVCWISADPTLDIRCLLTVAPERTAIVEVQKMTILFPRKWENPVWVLMVWMNKIGWVSHFIGSSFIFFFNGCRSLWKEFQGIQLYKEHSPFALFIPRFYLGVDLS